MLVVVSAGRGAIEAIDTEGRIRSGNLGPDRTGHIVAYICRTNRRRDRRADERESADEACGESGMLDRHHRYLQLLFPTSDRFLPMKQIESTKKDVII